MQRKYKCNIFDFSKPFKATRKDQAFFNVNFFTGRHKMKMRAFLLTYDWWIEQ